MKRFNPFFYSLKMNKHSFSTALAVATLGVAVLTPAANAFNVFTSRAAWEAAIAGATITTDPFDNDIAQAQSITLDSGIISTNSDPVGFDDNSVSGGVYNNATDGNGSTAAETVTWDFPEAIFAYGADFIGVEDGELTLTGNFDGTGDQTLTVSTEIGGANGFLGIVGEATFSSIVFGNNAITDNIFNIDNASFGVQAESQSTPEPSAVIALGLFGLGLGISKRVKRK